ncbi:hypothetical protein M0805_003587 [Coniferiporia weirii]|nr:hypothetical protein M0805_003587 [Coniferiporia weirii]
MFASFTSILPSGINFGGNKDERERDRQERERERAFQDETPRPRDVEQLQANPDRPKDGAADELGVKKRRERNPNETFIVVRPPPSVSNHPLNLQLQLVPPHGKERAVSGSSSVSGVSNLSIGSNRRSVDYSIRPPEASTEDEEIPLARSPSTRSNRSDPSSFYASPSTISSASMSSVVSSASTSSSGGRRMIVPLYNLSAHNVMTNTVLDAGTDAKVAKFHKRGLEILALAVFECVEVWPGFTRSGGGGRVTFLNVAAANGANTGGFQDSDALLHTPTSSAISLSSTGSHLPHPPPLPTTPTTPSKSTYLTRGNLTPTPTQSSAKKIFGKIFKRKDSQNQTSGDSRARAISIDIQADTSSPAGSELGHGIPTKNVKATSRRSLNGSFVASVASPTPSHFSVPVAPYGTTPAGTMVAAQPVLQPPILGIQPTLSSPFAQPAGRPTRYVWIVRRWLKGSEGGLLGGVMRGVGKVGAGMTGLAERAGGALLANNGIGEHGDGNWGGPQTGVEVRFEWVRGQSKTQSQKRKSTGQAALGKRSSLSRVSSQTSLGADPGAQRRDKSKTRTRRTKVGSGSGTGLVTPRMSGESRRSTERGPREESMSRDSRTNSMTSTTLSEDTAGVQKSAQQPDLSDEDDGEESDPEDSETPWTCTLIISSLPSNPSTMWEYERTAAGDAHHSLMTTHSLSRLHASGDSAAATPKPLSAAAAASPASASSTPPAKALRVDAPGTLLRLKVGTLSPAPHHPKVVAQLKVPFPLPDVEVASARARRRIVTPAGVARPVSRAGDDGREPEGPILTAEEIKDVLSCTAFWVVVREGFGGVGKVNRKGDGWRIRG